MPTDPQSQGAPLRLKHDAPDGSNRSGRKPRPEPCSPLSDAQFNEIRWCSKRAKPVEKAVRYAHFSGWTTLLGGVLSLPFSLGNPPMIVFLVVIAGIGTRELSVRRQLKMLDPSAPKNLAINQLMLGAALAIYAVFMLVSEPAKTMMESAMESDPMMQSTPELAGMMDDLVVFEQLATAMMYVAMIVLAVFIQGGTALYYWRKGSKLNKMLKETPEWVVRVYQNVHH